MRIGLVVDVARRPRERPTADEIIQWASGNTGNLAFQTVVERLLDCDVKEVSWRDEPAEVAEFADVLVVPEASVLNASKDFGWKADFVEAVDKPCLALGVGRQAELGCGPIAVPAGTVRYMQALAARSHVIGVRGERTAAELEHLGIANVRVLGCPSLFWSAGTPKAADPYSVARLVVSPGPDRHSLHGVHRRLAKWAVDFDGVAVAQSGRLLRATLDGGLQAPLIARRLRIGSGLKTPVRAFTNIPSWIDFLAEFDVSVGARIHGALLAAAAGTPALCIAHDDRTDELATTCALPTMRIREFCRASNLRRLLAEHPMSWDNHAKVKQALAEELSNVLALYGVAASAALRSVFE
jgi:hypothetical protein